MSLKSKKNFQNFQECILKIFYIKKNDYEKQENINIKVNKNIKFNEIIKVD